jgi:hypothetical protein
MPENLRRYVRSQQGRSEFSNGDWHLKIQLRNVTYMIFRFRNAYLLGSNYLAPLFVYQICGVPFTPILIMDSLSSCELTKDWAFFMLWKS